MPAGIVIFYLYRNKFLLILRDDIPTISFPNTWTPVTGGLDEGENLMICGKRESKEEIGLLAKNFKMLGVSEKGNGFFFGRLTDKEFNSIKLGEGQKYDVFDIEQLSIIPIAGAFKIYLERYPEIFRKMAKEDYEPTGKDFGLAIWNGNH